MRNMTSVPAPLQRRKEKQPAFLFNVTSYIRYMAVLFLLIMIGSKASAQEVIINNTTLLIAEGKYNDAEKYLDSILRTEPKNVTAMMMKGNVLLNYALMEAPAVQNITLEDETIFSKDVAGLKNRIVVIPRASAQKVQQLWKECLALDSTRLDIQKGLCSLYGMALMKNELIGYLPVIVKSSRDKGDDFAYTLVEYARLLHERGDKEGSYAVYRKIAELYPSVSGIWCVLAGVYFSDNDQMHTREYAEKAMSVARPDVVACHDAIDIYSAIAEPTKVLSMLKTAAKDTSYKDYRFYLAVYKYAHHDSTWRKDIGAYLGQFARTADSNAVYTAASLMALKNFPDDYRGIGTLLNYNLNDFSTKLLTERAMKEYKDSTLPYVVAAVVMLNDKNYTRANEILAQLTQKHPDAPDLQYYSAYSLYCSGSYKASLDKWNQYTATVKKAKADSGELDTYLAAPHYFTGRCYLSLGNKEKAIELFKAVDDSKDESKFAFLSKIMLDKLK